MVRIPCLVIAALAIGCGRVGFEPLDDGAAGDGRRSDGGGGMACPLTGTPGCPNSAASLSLTGMHLQSGRTSGGGNGLGGTCGGSSAEEQTVQFFVQQAGKFGFSTDGSDYDTVLYAKDTCGGAEIACNDDENATTKTSKLTLTLNAGQSIIIVIDGANGMCGNYVLRAASTP